MIVVNRLDDVISVSAGNQEFSTMHTEERFNELMKIAEKSEKVESMEDLEVLLKEVESICANSENEKIQSFHPDLAKDSKSENYFLRINKSTISSVPIPTALVRRIEESIDKGIDVSPLMKCWMRFLRNPKAKDKNFAKKFFNYIDMKYSNPKIKKEKLDAGFSEELADKMALVYQVKITNEGLINCYKVSSEVDWRYESNEDNDTAVRKPLYGKTFDPLTGEISGDERDDMKAEDRTFYPAIMGMNGGDAFWCEGDMINKEGHIIKVGHVHRLESWNMVNCNDDSSCVKGLHVGGLHYISYISGEIHNVFVDPMHVGAIPDDESGAMRVIQYFVHSTFCAVNKSIYHSSKYSEKTDEQWNLIKVEILLAHGELQETQEEEFKEIQSL